MSIAHGAQYASATVPLSLEDTTTHADGEPIGEGFEYIGERLTVLAVAARIMVRRHPGDVYARSIARETLRLAGAMREALHPEDAAHATHATRNTAPASGIVETTLATATATATATPSDAAHTLHTPASPSSAPPATPDATPAIPATRHRARGSARASALTSSSSKRKGGAV